MIHSINKRLLQQLSTALAADTGNTNWSTTSKRDQSSSHNGTSASGLVSRFNSSWDVITTRKIIAASLKPMQKSNIYQRPERSQNKTKILQQTWCKTHGTTLCQAGYLTTGCRSPNVKFASGSTRNRSKSISTASSRLSGRIKHNSPTMKSSCLSARCKLAYRTNGWPLNYTHEEKSYRKWREKTNTIAVRMNWRYPPKESLREE